MVKNLKFCQRIKNGLKLKHRLIFHTAWEIANMDERIEVDQIKAKI